MTIGKVKDTYIQYVAAGDQHVGRVVSGLPLLNVKYACTPHYFCIDPMDHNNASNEEAQNFCQLDDVNTVISALFPCKITTVFRTVAISCASALLFAKYFIHGQQPKTYIFSFLNICFTCTCILSLLTSGLSSGFQVSFVSTV